MTGLVRETIRDVVVVAVPTVGRTDMCSSLLSLDTYICERLQVEITSASCRLPAIGRPKTLQGHTISVRAGCVLMTCTMHVELWMGHMNACGTVGVFYP